MRATVVIALFTAVLLAGTAAEASSISFTDTFDPSDVFMVSNNSPSGTVCTGDNETPDSNPTPDSVTGTNCDSLSWTHYLTGFNSGTDTLTSGKLELYLYDNTGDPGSQAEKFDIFMDLQSANNQDIESPFNEFNVAVTNLADGMLAVTINAQNGDFWFDKSILFANGTRTDTPPDVSAVPEPASLLLLGTGLAAGAQRWRKRRQSLKG